jgi:hypothetical protein
MHLRSPLALPQLISHHNTSWLSVARANHYTPTPLEFRFIRHIRDVSRGTVSHLSPPSKSLPLDSNPSNSKPPTALHPNASRLSVPSFPVQQTDDVSQDDRCSDTSTIPPPASTSSNSTPSSIVNFDGNGIQEHQREADSVEAQPVVSSPRVFGPMVPFLRFTLIALQPQHTTREGARTRPLTTNPANYQGLQDSVSARAPLFRRCADCCSDAMKGTDAMRRLSPWSRPLARNAAECACIPLPSVRDIDLVTRLVTPSQISPSPDWRHMFTGRGLPRPLD